MNSAPGCRCFATRVWRWAEPADGKLGKTSVSLQISRWSQQKFAIVWFKRCPGLPVFASLNKAGEPASESPIHPQAKPSFADSGQAIAAGLFLFAAIWLLLLTNVSLSPPVDNIEQLTWVRSLQLGYYKHPPLPTWMLWCSVQVFGLSQRAAYLLGAFVTMGALAVMWKLVRELRGSVQAAISLLGTLCVTFYNGRLDYYNHNVLLMLAVTVSAWCCWRAFGSQKLRWWFALGLTLGLGALAKYQVAITVMSVLCFFVSQQAWRERAHVRGLLLAILVGFLVLVPHLVWLFQHDFGPVRYAMTTSLGRHLGTGARMFNALNWIADEIFNRSLLALVLVGLCARKVMRSPMGQSTLVRPLPREGGAATALIWCWAGVPLVFIPAVAIFFGSDLQLQWGTAFLPFLVPAAMQVKSSCFWSRVRLGFAFKVFVAVQTILLVVNFCTSPAGIPRFRDTHWRSFDSKALAFAVAAPARAALGGPVRVVIGNAAFAGALALQMPERPLVLIDGRYDLSPWVPIELVSQCGAIELITTASPPADAVAAGSAFPELFWRSIAPLQGGKECQENNLRS